MKTPVVFLHVPKTAGTTMRSVMSRVYKGRLTYEIKNDINRYIDEFRELPQKDRDALVLLQGHMSFGLHEYLPQGATYVTMLREPVSRAISDYAFVSTTPPHPLYESVSMMSIGEYFSSNITGQLSNGQVRLISGDSGEQGTGIPTLRQLTQADLERAHDNLKEHFCVVGLQERFDESLIMMRRRLGWRLPFYVRENVTRRGSKPKPNPLDLEQIKAQNALDIALYDERLKQFDQDVANAGLSFKLELACFRLLNRLYATCRLADGRALRRGVGPIVKRLLPTRR